MMLTRRTVSKNLFGPCQERFIWALFVKRSNMYMITALVLAIGLAVASSEAVCRGSRVEREESNEALPPMWCNRPELDCSNENIDAATMTIDKRTYLFKGDYYWRLIESKVAPGYPRLISQDWDGLPGHLDAALTWNDGRTFFFKGSQYWSFHGKVMDRSYPRNISEGFCGIPDNLDAAFLWKPNNRTYFFKGSQYWRFEGGESCTPVQKGYPMSIHSEWTDMPDDIDAAIECDSGRNYFLKGNKYYRYDHFKNDTNSGKPLDIANNLGLACVDLKCRIPSFYCTQ